MDLKSDKNDDLINEIMGKNIIHWNYRGLSQLPEAIRFCAQDVKEIYLKDNELKTLPEWIIDLVNVTHLYLNGNNLKEIPQELGSMRNLTLLNLSKNGICELSTCIGDLKTLESLNLNDNYLKNIPKELSNLKNLRSLSLCNNEFIVLPEWLGSLEKLEQLKADENSLRELPNRLTTAPNLCVLSICSNRLTYLPLNGFVSHPSVYFHSNPYLNYLSYPMFRQLIRNPVNRNIPLTKVSTNPLITRDNKNLRISTLSKEGEKTVIELPRQLLNVHSININHPVTLWELAVRRLHTYRREVQNIEEDNASLRVSYNLLINGPVAICSNENCQEPIFTETWLVVVISCPRDSFSQRVPIVVLYCCKNCALHHELLLEEFEEIKWDLVHQ
ncbi:leucine-rich repeat-containing protein 28-like isoform X1 [Venturia canescens]|uniref:leucine-rich repeat-containing protein 28-like isoform X1 n=1 Tax=Venturia canescens TaxID=32260 RepID=UPI001C9CBF1C|nr:leucine-rich repeat-containing protein 28-like isoform X1 [Venturia canescens]